ncbi:MAG: hypothetical protein J6M24_07235 [Lachnospiraceae bacterium]|nr:hypothetical protein [Lachnospiraceae bacterium]
MGNINDKWLDIEKYKSIFNVIKEDKECRDHSYEHCRRFFKDNREACINEKEGNYIKCDLMALHLFAYLASFGMLHNSWILQKDYKFFIPFVKIICDDKYKDLLDYEPSDNDYQNKIELILDLKKELNKRFAEEVFYKDYKDEKNTGKKMSDTLFSKIILGTFGCIPAYDICVVEGLSSMGITTTCNKVSLQGIFDLVINNKETIDKLKDEIKNNKVLYTSMRIVDLCLWKKGDDILKAQKTNNRS